MLLKLTVAAALMRVSFIVTKHSKSKVPTFNKTVLSLTLGDFILRVHQRLKKPREQINFPKHRIFPKNYVKLWKQHEKFHSKLSTQTAASWFWFY
jgi:hypothetical protein